MAIGEDGDFGEEALWELTFEKAGVKIEDESERTCECAGVKPHLHLLAKTSFEVGTIPEDDTRRIPSTHKVRNAEQTEFDGGQNIGNTMHGENPNLAGRLSGRGRRTQFAAETFDDHFRFLPGIGDFAEAVFG